MAYDSPSNERAVPAEWLTRLIGPVCCQRKAGLLDGGTVRKPQRKLGGSYSRVDLSYYHLYSAFFFMHHAERIEETASEVADTDIVYRYRSFVMGSVLSSVAFLEAKIAELRSDAESGGG